MTMQEIQSAIAQLPVGEVAKLLAWLTEYRAQLWDQQIENDLISGRLDGLLNEVEKEYITGLARPI
jgi:hypothetical protein